MKSEIFAELLEAVSRETEVPADLITGCDKKAETVDARYLLVYLLRRRGLYPSMIAPMVGLKKRAVNHILSDFDVRLSVTPLMRLYLARLERRGG